MYSLLEKNNYEYGYVFQHIHSWCTCTLCLQVGLFAKKLHITGMVRDAPKLSLPGKLVFPSMHNSGHFSMLGLGDIVSQQEIITQFSLIESQWPARINKDGFTLSAREIVVNRKTISEFSK